MGTYAILDAAKMPYLLTSELEASGLEYQSLFQGEAQEDLGEHAPYIVKLEDGNDFTRKLFTDLEPPLGLWKKELGIFVRSRASLADLRKHFRKFTRVQDENGKWYYFRFWEPALIQFFLKDKNGQRALARFFNFESPLRPNICLFSGNSFFRTGRFSLGSDVLQKKELFLLLRYYGYWVTLKEVWKNPNLESCYENQEAYFAECKMCLSRHKFTNSESIYWVAKFVMIKGVVAFETRFRSSLPATDHISERLIANSIRLIFERKMA